MAVRYGKPSCQGFACWQRAAYGCRTCGRYLCDGCAEAHEKLHAGMIDPLNPAPEVIHAEG